MLQVLVVPPADIVTVAVKLPTVPATTETEDPVVEPGMVPFR